MSPDPSSPDPSSPDPSSNAPVADGLTYALADGVATTTIDAVDAGNSLTASMRDGLTDLFEWASSDHHVRAIVLTGSYVRRAARGFDPLVDALRVEHDA